MAWEDRTPFDAITAQFGISESETIKLMRENMKRSSFKMWRERVQRRKTKHQELRNIGVNRFKNISYTPPYDFCKKFKDKFC